MVDVRLLYPTDKLEAAVRLAEALEGAGYTVERQALADSVAFPSLPATRTAGDVLLLIWSRGLVTAAMSGGLAEARRRPNLIEVSVDGIEPGVGGEVSPVILLSGWRGQPFHLGWQRILADIKRLSGPREAPKKRGSPLPASASRQGPSEAAGRPARPRAGGRAALAAGALLVATLGAASALDWSGPATAPDVRAVRPAAADVAVPVAIAPAPAPLPVEAAAPASASDSLPAPPASRPPGPRAETAAAEPRKTASARRPAAKRLALAPEPQIKRYSRKHSKTMRLFCQRSGRSTPQCRTFARSMRDRRG